MTLIESLQKHRGYKCEAVCYVMFMWFLILLLLVPMFSDMVDTHIYFCS